MTLPLTTPTPSRTVVYVDGFNLYHGALEGHPGRKWLDLLALSKRLLAHDQIVAIRYFTAKVSGKLADRNAGFRQSIYLRALETIPGLSVHFGSFISNKQWCTRADTGVRVEVNRMEEKQTDVNMAIHVVRDGLQGLYDVAVLMTNDSDQVGTVEMMKKEGKQVGVFNPHADNPKSFASYELKQVASFYKPIRTQTVIDCQFPDEILDAQGRTIRRPAEWR
jgi:uncharacterized LabA/DUF88 family protein